MIGHLIVAGVLLFVAYPLWVRMALKAPTLREHAMFQVFAWTSVVAGVLQVVAVT